MHSYTISLLYTITTILPTALTSGVPLVVSPGLNFSTNPQIPANLSSCTNLTLAPTPPCYTTLNTTSYLLNYNLTSAEVCAPQESWSTCLLRSVYSIAGANCTTQAPGVQFCQPFNCYDLNSTTCVQPRTSNYTGVTRIEAQGWYAVWNVYAVWNHTRAWATALNQKASEGAILAAINPRVANTPTTVLTSLIQDYSINHNVDNALLDLLNNTKPKLEKAWGNVRVRGESNTLSGTQWRQVLRDRLDDALGAANFDFDVWLEVVKGGAFSTRGLKGARDLGKRLAEES